MDLNTDEEKEMVDTIYQNAIDGLSEDDKRLPQVPVCFYGWLLWLAIVTLMAASSLSVTNPSVSHSRFSLVLSCLEELEEPLLAAVKLLTCVMRVCMWNHCGAFWLLPHIRNCSSAPNLQLRVRLLFFRFEYLN